MRNISTKNRKRHSPESVPANLHDLLALLKDLHPDQAANITKIWAVSGYAQRQQLLELAAQAASVERQLILLRADLAPQLEEAQRQQQLAKDQEAIAVIERMQAEAAAHSPEENASLRAEWDEIMKALEETAPRSESQSNAA